MSVRKGYMVVSTVFEYDDNYYSDNGAITFNKHIYRSREGEDGADAACLRANMEHAREVARTLDDWLGGDSLGSYVCPDIGGNYRDADLRVTRRVYSIFVSNNEDAETVEVAEIVERLNRASSLQNISDEDAQFLSENLALFCDSHVEEVVVEDWPEKCA